MVGTVKAMFGEKREMAVISVVVLLALAAFYAVYYQMSGPRQRLHMEPFLLMLSVFGFAEVGGDRRFR